MLTWPRPWPAACPRHGWEGRTCFRPSPSAPPPHPSLSLSVPCTEPGDAEIVVNDLFSNLSDVLETLGVVDGEHDEEALPRPHVLVPHGAVLLQTGKDHKSAQ